MPPPTPEQLLIQTAVPQFGLINLAQALAAGYTICQVKYRLRSGRWQRVLERVYRIAGAPPSWEADAMGALLWDVEGCALSFGAAARIHGIYGFQRFTWAQIRFRPHYVIEMIRTHLALRPRPTTSVS
jgi:hypothetical protein